MKAHARMALLALILLFTTSMLLAGCGSNNSAGSSGTQSKQQASSSAKSDSGAATGQSGSGSKAAQSGPFPGIDTSQPVQLTMYLLGSAPKGLQAVQDVLNQKLKKDINATIQINYIDWGDVQSKYPLLLASGEPVDIVYTADWNYYAQEASKGAFLQLSQNMLQKYMPRHWKATSQEIWNGSKVGGKFYMIPTSSPDKKVPMALIRDDLRKKYNLPQITKFSQLGPYLAAIKKNNPDMIPLSMDSNTDLPMPFDNLMAEKSAYTNLATTNASSIGVGYDQMDSSGKIIYQLDPSQMDAEKFAANTMKDWYDKGYVIKNPYANKVRSKDQFCDGKVGVALGNSIDLQSVIAQCQSKGIKVDLLPVWWPNGKGALASPMNNGVAIGANSKHPHRAMMAMDLIMEDPAYNYLVYYGIEGKNYVITSDGKIGLPDGVTADSNTYPPDAAGFWFTDKNEFKPLASWTTQYQQLQDQLKKNLVVPKYSGFSFNPDKVKTQMANITNVSTQYADPIYIGAVKNVDQAFSNLDSKLKAAGIQDVQKELQKQIDAYNSNH